MKCLLVCTFSWASSTLHSTLFMRCNGDVYPSNLSISAPEVQSVGKLLRRKLETDSKCFSSRSRCSAGDKDMRELLLRSFCLFYVS